MCWLRNLFERLRLDQYGMVTPAPAKRKQGNQAANT